MSESAMPEIGGRRPIPVNVEAGKSLRPFRESVALRRLAQRHGFHSGRIQTRSCGRGLVLRLQALGEKTDVRRQSQKTLMNASDA